MILAPLVTCESKKCSEHATCYLGTCLCHPGYEGADCNERMLEANPWYTSDCPNLLDTTGNTLDINLTHVGGVKGCNGGESFGTGLSYCAYLCYSNVEYGTPIIPYHIWKMAQQAESGLWETVAKGAEVPGNDRFEDHSAGFANYLCVPPVLGKVAEIGAGPWTQFRGLLSKRPDVQVESYTVIEPGAEAYIANVDNCAYKTGKLFKAAKSGNLTFYDFPVHIFSEPGGESKGDHI